MTILTPQTLAFILDLDEREVRAKLRYFYPDSAPGKGGRWMITPRMAQKVARSARTDAIRAAA